MRKKLLLSMLMVLLSTLFSFAKTGDDPVIERKTYELVVIPADTSMGDLYIADIPEGSSVLPENLSNNRPGYEFDHWESVHGVDLNNVQMNDTIIVYFKKLQEVPVTIISSDTTKGTVTATPIYYDYEKIYLNLVAKEGYKYAYWYNLKDTTKKISGTTLYASANDTIVCIFLPTPEYAEESTLEYNYCKIVALTSDSAKGTVKPIEELVGDGNMIPLSATPNRGYKFDHWESVKGYDVEYAFGNDTIYAYFDTVPSYNIVVVSSDTTMGSFYGSGIFYEGEKLPLTVSTGDTYITKPFIKINDGYHLDYFVSKSKGHTMYLFDGYVVTDNDTIVAYFRKDTTPSDSEDTTPSDPVIDFPQARLYVWVERLSRVDFYGNMLQGMKFTDEDDVYDSLVITNKKTGITDTISRYDDYYLTLGDTVSFFIITKDEFKSDSVYTVTYTDPSQTTIYENISLYNKTRKIELTEAEGDSFNVNIVYTRSLYNSPIVVKNEWEGNGRYAKGDTIVVVYHGIFLTTNIDENVEYFELPEEMKFVVNNDIDILFYSFEDNFMIDVKQITAEKENFEDAYVNVYTINGYLLKQNVKKEDALDGLRKGLYIVGGKKVYVKN